MKQTFETKETILVAAEKAVREYRNINECYYKGEQPCKTD